MCAIFLVIPTEATPCGAERRDLAVRALANWQRARNKHPLRSGLSFEPGDGSNSG